MKIIIDYLNKQDDLRHVAAGITAVIMAFFFLLAQILAFTSLLSNSEVFKKKMEVRELLKLRFTQQLRQRVNKKVNRVKIKKQAHTSRTQQPKYQKADASLNIASLVKGIDIKKMVSYKKGTARRGRAASPTKAKAGISTRVHRQQENQFNWALNGSVNVKPSYRTGARRAARGGVRGPKVEIGGTSSFGNGLGSGDGIDISGQGTHRAIRGTGGGSGGSKIGLPSVASGGSDASIDIHARIKWMKAHPGTIPRLVAHDMGHHTGDLSSAVCFTMNGRSFNLFLSCNEVELLLRICLVEANDFTLLKDNGIKEKSNFLTIGNVIRQRGKIQSLISSRRAPGSRAKAFYQIFWTWWQQQQK